MSSPSILAFASALFAAGPVDVSSQPLEPRIYGGEALDEAWAMAALRITGPEPCSAVLVAPELLLTAAHCVADASGSVFIEAPGLPSFASSSFAAVSTYDPEAKTERHDLAWIRLDDPAMVASLDEAGIVPATLLTEQAELDELLSPGVSVWLVGYGEHDISGLADGVRVGVETTITELSRHGLEFEAGGDGADSCSGDSGGPVFAQLASGEWRVVGLTARGDSSCEDGGVFTVPLPDLCEIGQVSGVALTLPSCGSCTCVELPAEAQRGCALIEVAPDERMALGLLALMLLAGVRGRRGRGPRAALAARRLGRVRRADHLVR